MNVKKYKLVPLSFFKGLENEENVETSGRSLRDIIPTVKDTNFEPSKHYVADFKIGKTKTGSGWLPGESTYLLETLNEVLDNQTVPEDLKIKLYMILKQKYDNVEKVPQQKQIDKLTLFDADVESPRSVLVKAISKMGKTKIKVGFTLANILVDEPKNLKWNAAGDIIYPVLKDYGAFDMGNLVKAILMKDVTLLHTNLAEQVIRPFYHRLEEAGVIFNKKLIRDKKPINMSKYVAW